MNCQILERNGWVMNCPFCGEAINYTLINNQRVPVPFFYGEDCNDVLLRKSDEKIVDNVYAKLNGEHPSVEVLRDLWHEILKSAPATNCGGKFGFWSNVKCPSCASEMPYSNGVRNLEQRIYEPKIILIEGALLTGDTESQSWVIKIRPQ